MNTVYQHKYTFIRLIIPWIAGVFCGDYYSERSFPLLWGFLFFGLFAASSVASHFLRRYSLRWCFGLSVFALCFTGGWTGATWQLQQSVYDFPEEETVYRVLLTDRPELKERSFLCRVLVEELHDSTSIYPVKVERKAILYLQKDSLVSQLKEGDRMFVSSRISPPANGNNFDEFDYARYLKRKGISGTGYVSSGEWQRLSSVPFKSDVSFYSLKLIADSYREKVIALYRRLGFEEDELAVLSALTVGDKTDLSESIRESYSVSGASHVLALSGLHIGLLYALFFLLLKPVAGRWRGGRCLHSILLLVLLWGFAFFTGLSPSVVRSVSICSMLALAAMFGRNSVSLNTLAATAWLMLFFNPVWLFDVGFQLSFLAVASILLIQKPIYRLHPVRNKIEKYVWGLMSVSIAAQLGTAPLVIFYFSRFSTHFLLTNLLVIPLVTIALYAAVLMLFLTPLPSVQLIVAEGVKFLLKALNDIVRWIEKLPYASFDGIWLYQLEVLGIYVAFLLFLYYIMKRRFKNLLLCLSFLLCLGIYHTAMRWQDRPRSSLVFYNIRGCPAVHCIENDGRSWLNYGDTLSDKARLQNVAANYWRHHQLLPPIEVEADYLDAGLFRRQQTLSFHDCRVCMITDDRWRTKTAAAPLSIHYLYLCRGYSGRLEELTRVFLPSCIVLDASLTNYRKRLLTDECEKLGLRFISLSEEGSVRFLL